jgi:hypothetical protein
VIEVMPQIDGQEKQVFFGQKERKKCALIWHMKNEKSNQFGSVSRKLWAEISGKLLNRCKSHIFTKIEPVQLIHMPYLS